MDLATGRARLGLAPLARRGERLPAAGEAVDRRVVGAAGEAGVGADEAFDLERHALGQLLDGEVRAEVVRDRVEAAAVDDPRAAAPGGRVVVEPGAVDELGLAGEVDVVGPGGGAGGDQRAAVERVRADRGYDNPGGLGDLGERRRVGGVGLDQGRGRRRGAGGGEARGHRLELRPVAPDQRPAQPLGRVGGEVLGGQPAGETGGPEQNKVVLPLPRHRRALCRLGSQLAERCVT